MSHAPLPWFAHIVNYLATRKILPHWSKQERDRFFSQVRHYYWEDPYLFKHYLDQVVRRYVPESEIHSILTFCHSYVCGGHFSKVLQSGFFWSLYLEMLTDSVLLMSMVNVWVPYPVVI